MLASWIRLAFAWTTVAVFFIFGGDWLADLSSTPKSLALFAWLFVIILWCVFGVVKEADHLAEMLGEPLGTLVLTLSVVIIEVVLIGAVMLDAKESPTVGRDTMFAVLMIILNGVVGLVLLLGGLKHVEQSYNLQGASAYLALILPLSFIALILPNFTQSTADGSLTRTQAFFFSLFTVTLYGIFLVIQTGRHRGFFIEPGQEEVAAHAAPVTHSRGEVMRHVALLVVTILPIVLLSKQLAKLVDHSIAVLGAPPVLGGVLIAIIIFTPEGLSALRAALDNQLQRATNLCLGAAASTIGLTVPAVLGIGLLTGKPVVLGLDQAGMALLALTLLLSTITFSGTRTTLLEGAVHLVVFMVYIVLIFSP
ncbi:calcium:proton antiporter [Noviherbaspirillum cavernae]|uniref:Calcium:proton antiporter n=1 Tax=Noviherbaspirillum cavernae TaxID=2320862 RepID=A0A418X4Q1_9BURK|nr:calcium:proton antiporter [Noviherbaspirillum cavernae]RJG07389.1 calcium:proton antiporter [Noviherbaspirillum cavernae]